MSELGLMGFIGLMENKRITSSNRQLSNHTNPKNPINPSSDYGASDILSCIPALVFTVGAADDI